VLVAFDHASGQEVVATGWDEIQGFFEGLFETLSDTSDLGVQVLDVSEEEGVYLVWSGAASGIVSATDTFIFDDDNKIIRQNIAFVYGGYTHCYYYHITASCLIVDHRARMHNSATYM
jgi:hypothetical protein